MLEDGNHGNMNVWPKHRPYTADWLADEARRCIAAIDVVVGRSVVSRTGDRSVPRQAASRSRRCSVK